MEIPFQIILASIASIIFISVFLYTINLLRENESKNRVIESFMNLKNKLENLCWSFPFSQENEKIFLNEDVIAIFAFYEDITKINDFETISDRIIEGNFICLAYKNQRIKCEKLSCNITMKTYYYEKATDLPSFFLRLLQGLKEFEINYILYRNLTKVDII